MGRGRRIMGISNQLPFDFEEAARARPVRDALFFALRPEPRTALKLVETGRTLRERYWLKGAVQPAARLHVTLIGFRVEANALDAGIELACWIGAAVRRAPFPIVLEGAMSFGGEGHRALVLRCGLGSEAALMGLHDRLRDLTDDLGVSRAGVHERFVPHLTVAYDASPIPETALDAPISWMANQLVLIRSEQGLGRHTTVGRWPLRAA